MNAKPFLKNNMPQYAPYNCSNSSKDNPEKKTMVTLPKNQYTRKAWIVALNRKEGTPMKDQDTSVKSTTHCRVLF